MFKIEEEIKKRHGGSIGEITMCIDTYSNDLIITDKSKTLEALGLQPDMERMLLYDFQAIKAPMLTTQFNYKLKDGE